MISGCVVGDHDFEEGVDEAWFVGEGVAEGVEGDDVCKGLLAGFADGGEEVEDRGLVWGALDAEEEAVEEEAWEGLGTGLGAVREGSSDEDVVAAVDALEAEEDGGEDELVHGNGSFGGEVRQLAVH